MANSKTVFESIQSELIPFDREEAQAIALLMMEHFYQLSLADILAQKPIVPQNCAAFIERLNRHEPIQYVLGYAYFFERKFLVNSSVLIPRPETEWLVAEIIKEKKMSPEILDVGTGSGCIAISLKLEIPTANVHALDVSAGALATASQNAETLQARINFIQANFLTDTITINPVDILVSNPPYVAYAERTLMQQNVLLYEPHTALFVPDNNPLLFYHALARQSKNILKPDGKIFVEINERLGAEVKKLFEQAGFIKTRIVKDIDGKDRVVVASRS